MISFSDTLESNDSITAFTDQNIASETQSDEFFVVVFPHQEGVAKDFDLEHLSTEIKVNISVELQNDEWLVHVVDKAFHVVWNGQHLLTLADLCYHDPDLDFDDGQLLYTRRDIPNGELVRASNPMENFTSSPRKICGKDASSSNIRVQTLPALCYL